MSRVNEEHDLEMETHKDEDPVSVRFPVLDHLLVFFLRPFQIH